MIDYATYRRIHHLNEAETLNVAQIAKRLALDPRTVRYWLDEPTFRPRQTAPRPSKLDPYKPLIRQWLEHYPYSGTQIFQRLGDNGYTGGISIVREYVQKVRPKTAPAFLTLHFEPGECAQVDWGHYGSVNVGNTRRQLSFFVLVLCYSRMMYVEFTVSQTLEHFLGCHLNAFEALGARVPARIMVDNLKSAVLRRLSGEAPVFNPRYVDFARHYGFTIAPCNVGAGHEKGRVEAGVGTVNKTLLAGLEINDFSLINPIAREWLDTVANVRTHGETHRAIARRIRLARFPVNKTLDAFDWTWPKKINRQQVMNLFRLQFVEQASNVVFIGGVGLGKSHLAIALGLRACEERYSVLFASAVDVVNTLAAAQATGRLKQGLNRYLKPLVLVLDELGYFPIDKTGADLLFQIVSQRYERGATVITTNRVYRKWPEIFNNDATLTSAVLDRLLHHAETVVTEGTQTVFTGLSTTRRSWAGPFFCRDRSAPH